MSITVDNQLGSNKSEKSVKNKQKMEREMCEHCIRLKSQNKNLSDENSSLKAVNKELYEIDKRRQNYDIERQDYILRLLQTIKKLQLRSSQTISSDSDSDCLTERQKTLLMSSTKHQKENKDIQKSEKSLLQQSYENAIKENVNLEKELQEMRTNFDQLIEELTKKENEKIEVLEIEAKLYKEDFESEKIDKELALKQFNRVCVENEMLTKICKKYEKKLQNFVEMFGNTDLLRNKKDLKHSSSLTIIGLNEEKIKTNSLPNDFKIKINNSNEFKNKTHSDLEDMIECPNCRILFSLQFFEQLLEHFEKCQTNI